MLESSEVVAFVGAADLARARAFYEGTLGLPVVEHHDFACVFDANGTMLLAGVFSQVVRELPEVAYQLEQPFIIDSSSAEATFGLAPTPCEQVLAEMIDFYRGHRAEPRVAHAAASPAR